MVATWVNYREQPVHTLFLDNFYIDRYETTVEQYLACIDDGVCLQHWSMTNWINAIRLNNDDKYNNFPISGVTWINAKTYCEWRGGHLPSEAQWEKAARGGLEGKLYPWGDQTPSCSEGVIYGVNYRNCYITSISGVNITYGNGGTVKVGSFSPNSYGLYDMVGNVWEWVSSLYFSYPYNATDGREDLLIDGSRVLRGGSFGGYPSDIRVYSRFTSNPDVPLGTVGFRCARMP